MMSKILKLDANERAKDYEAEIIASIIQKSVLSKVSINRYPDAKAIKLRKAYSKYSKIPYENLVAGNGSDELIDLAFSVFAQSKTVVCFDPDFSMYEVYSKKYNASLIKVKTMKLEDLINAARINMASVIVFSNPNNPTGKGFLKSDVEQLVKTFWGTVIVDEAYMDFYNQSVSDLISKYDNLVITKTCSKALGLAGIRVGFLGSNSKNIDKIEQIRSPYNVNSLTQNIATEILSYPKLITKYIKEVKCSRDDLYSSLIAEINDDETQIYESSANFIYMKTKYSADIYEYLLEKGILIRLFEDGIRITVGNIEDNVKLVSELKRAISLAKEERRGYQNERAV